VRRHSDLQPLADALRGLRKTAGYTQESFAYESHLDRGFVGAVERAERNVGYRKLRQLLVGLGISWRDFGAALHELDPLPTRPHPHRRGRRD
jgi:transcriptional regulator with XRE-family HTH domain